MAIALRKIRNNFFNRKCSALNAFIATSFLINGCSSSGNLFSSHQTAVASAQGLYILSTGGINFLPTGQSKSNPLSSARDLQSTATGVQFQNIAVDSSAIYVGTNQGLDISRDGGQTYQIRNTSNGLPADSITSLAVYQGIIYCGTVQGLGISTDGGESFSIKNSGNGLAGNNITYLSIDNSGLFVGSSNPGALTFSSDLGNSYTILTDAPAVTAVSKSEDNLYVTSNCNTYVSSDGGNTFIILNILQSLCLPYLFSNGTSIFSADPTDFYYSSDGGSTANELINPFGFKINNMMVFDNDLFVATNGAGVFKSVDDGATFSPTLLELPSTTVKQMVAY